MRFSPTEFDIVDCHTHVYPPKIAAKAAQNIGEFYELPARCRGGVEELLEDGRKYGINNYLVCSAATTPAQVSFINKFIRDACREHAEFIGFGTMHPDCDVEAETRAIAEYGLRGIKLHPDFQEFYIDAPEAYPIYEHASAHGLPILFHIGDNRYSFSEPERLNRVLNDFPDLQVIAAHLGGYHVWDTDRSFLKRDNVWFDCSSTLALIGPEATAEEIRRMGVEKVFFGTDFPLWDYDEEVARFFELPMSRSEYEAILAGNFRAFLKAQTVR
ncbi:MAG: amidohydrolase [Oscillospiraceae bacterium]|nr:amidohydrolase [Oscillospiraceae bacterium]